MRRRTCGLPKKGFTAPMKTAITRCMNIDEHRPIGATMFDLGFTLSENELDLPFDQSHVLRPFYGASSMLRLRVHRHRPL